MFKKILLTSLVLSIAFASGYAEKQEKPTSFPKIKYVGNGKFRITNGKRKLIVNLGDDFAGCKDMVTLHVIDKTEKDKKIYVVLLVEAASRCNPQGMCGAAEPSLTLIWLKLNPLLKLEDKKAVIIDDCAQQIFLTGYDAMTDAVKIVRMEKGVLTVEYEQSEYSEGSDTPKEWRLIYNRNNPEKAFVITPLN